MTSNPKAYWENNKYSHRLVQVLVDEEGNFLIGTRFQFQGKFFARDCLASAIRFAAANATPPSSPRQPSLPLDDLDIRL